MKPTVPPTIRRQEFYRLAEGTTAVPQEAPRHLRWHNLDNAIGAIQAWVRNSPQAAGYIGDDDAMSIRTGPYELRVTEVVDLPTNMQQNDSESDVSGGCPYVALVRARVYVERRFYREERRRVTAVVDGVDVEGYGPPERVYLSDWTSAWVKKRRWYEGDRAYATVSIPIVRDAIEWADEEVSNGGW